MSVDQATVRRIAHLARIAVEDDEVEHLRAELNAILSFVEELSSVDVDGVEPMTSVMPMQMKKRARRRHRRRLRRRHSRQCAGARRPLSSSCPRSSSNQPRNASAARRRASTKERNASCPIPRISHSPKRATRSSRKTLSAVELTPRAYRRDREGARAERLLTETPELALAAAHDSDARIAQRRGAPARGPAARHQGSLLHQGRAHDGGQPHPRRLHAHL